MRKVLRSLKGRNLREYDEANTKQAVVLPVLDALGWDIFDVDEVEPEYRIEGKSAVDYALKGEDGRAKVFIEVKAPGERLEGHQEQLLKYAFKEGVELAVLTNGLEWWMYLPIRKVRWRERRFLALDLGGGDAEAVAEGLTRFLLKERVLSGEALKDAEKLHSERAVEEAILRTWEAILSEPDGELVRLLGERVRERYGYRPSLERLRAFLKGRGATSPTPLPLAEAEETDFTGKKPRAVILNNVRIEVRSWREAVREVVRFLYARHRRGFWKRVKDLKGKKRRYVSRSPEGMVAPARISPELYVETNLNANFAHRLLRLLASRFGYTLRIEAYG